MTRIDAGDGIVARSFEAGDAERLVRYANNARIAAQLRDAFPHPYTATDAEAWLGRVLDDAHSTAFALANADGLIGGIGLELQRDVHRRSAEIGYWIGEPFQGRGIATRAVIAVSDWAFENLDVCRLFAGVFESNPASARVLAKAGYVFESRQRRAITKHGRTMDMLVWAMVRE